MAHYNPIIDDPGFETDLVSAASYGDTSSIQQLLCNPETDLNGANASGWTALMYAAHYGHYQVVDELIRAGCNVNATEPSTGRTALMMAAANGHTYCVERLVHSGRVDLHAQDLNGLMAADHAKNCGHGKNTAIVRALQMASPKTSNHRTDLDQRTTVKGKSSSTYTIDSGNNSSASWELPNLDIQLSPILATSTPQRRPVSRRLFPAPSLTKDNDLPLIEECLDAVPNGADSFTFTNLPKNELKRLGAAKLPRPVSVHIFLDGSIVKLDMPEDNVALVKLLEDRDFLIKKVEKLEEVIRIFHFMTKQMIDKVQTNI